MADPAHEASLGYVRCSLSISRKKQTKGRCEDSYYGAIRRSKNNMNCKAQWSW